jgi:hypothetical protein
MPASICSTLLHKLPKKNENDYNKLFISILANLIPINLNINYYAKIIETIK